MKVKAISLWEPWASLMRCGAKTIETRSWATSYRGPLLICAAKRWTPEQEDYLMSPPVVQALHKGSCDRFEFISRLHRGYAVCIVDILSCTATDKLLAVRNFFINTEREQKLGDFSPGRFGWVTNNLRTFKPFPVTGHQGLFDVEVPDSLLLPPAGQNGAGT